MDQVVGIFTSLVDGDDYGHHYAIYEDENVASLSELSPMERQQVLSRYRERYGVALQAAA